jgi:hypothetical protein
MSGGGGVWLGTGASAPTVARSAAAVARHPRRLRALAAAGLEPFTALHVRHALAVDRLGAGGAGGVAAARECKRERKQRCMAIRQRDRRAATETLFPHDLSSRYEAARRTSAALLRPLSAALPPDCVLRGRFYQ